MVTTIRMKRNVAKRVKLTTIARASRVVHFATGFS
jgi:hypothetical protein